MIIENNIFMWYNRDEDGNLVSVRIQNEEQTVINNMVFLVQIPDRKYAVRITHDGAQMVESRKSSALLGKNEFYVDYESGYVIFHPSMMGEIVVIEEYYGRGMIMFPANRIYSKITLNPDNSGVVDSTFQDFIDAVLNYSFIGPYDDSVKYEAENQVYYYGSTYRALKAVPVGTPPTDPEYWHLMTLGFIYLGIVDPEKIYYEGAVVSDGFTLYLCLKKSAGNNLADAESWTKLLSIAEIQQNWEILRAEVDAAVKAANDAAEAANSANAEITAAEALRVEAENARSSAEALRVAAETVREENESKRVEAENLRQDAENVRTEAEAERVAAETSRVEAETGRVSSFETIRIDWQGVDGTGGIKKEAEDATDAANAAALTASEASADIVGFHSAGEYSAETEYDEHNLVLFGGSTYQAKTHSLGVSPPPYPETENENWILVARRGEDGLGSGDGETITSYNDHFGLVGKTDAMPNEVFAKTLDGSFRFASLSELGAMLDASGFDCGFFVEPESEEVKKHNLSPNAHRNLVLDGNTLVRSVENETSLEEHMVDPYAHQNIIVDGNQNG